MSYRLQVLLDPSEMEEIRELADRHRLTVAEWVRQALRDARRRAPVIDARAKLAAVRRGAGHTFPAGDLPQMLRETEQGYER